MKDFVIKWKWVKREIVIILLIYVAVNLLNVLSILAYNTSWNEIVTSQLYILFITEWLYFISIFVRLVYFGIRYVIKK